MGDRGGFEEEWRSTLVCTRDLNISRCSREDLSSSSVGRSCGTFLFPTTPGLKLHRRFPSTIYMSGTRVCKLSQPSRPQPEKNFGRLGSPSEALVVGSGEGYMGGTFFFFCAASSCYCPGTPVNQTVMERKGYKRECPLFGQLQ